MTRVRLCVVWKALLSLPRRVQVEMGHVDRHNQFRQGLLHLAKTWKTKTWQTRVQLELLGLTLVDAFLACRVCMPKWKAMSDNESVFWLFAHQVITQLDARPASERPEREDVPFCPTELCKHVSMGQYRIRTGTYKVCLKNKRSRCKYCKERMNIHDQKGRPPPTCFGCSHHGLAICKKSIVGNVIWPSTKKSLPFRFRSVAVVFPISVV